MNWSLSKWENTNTLSFIDVPADSLLANGSFLGFTTQLVGILPNGTHAPLPEQWTWIDTFNGTSGSITAVTASFLPVDPGSGTGGVTITSINSVVQTPPSVICMASQNTLWPPDDRAVLVTVSGTITSGTQPIPAASTTYAVIDEYGQVQPNGSVALGPGGSYSFGVSLIAARDGNDRDGRKYTIIVNARDNVGNRGSCSAVVTVPHDQANQ